jgi:uncharacterized protein (DUF1697 family)
MGRRIILLRGINLGPRNRVPMAELRELLAGAGFEDVRTYLQSGNVVLSSDTPPGELERECERLIAEHFGLQVAVVARTGEELDRVVRHNPLADVASDPKRYQVSFLNAELDPARVAKLQATATQSERLIAIGRELYAWHPAGIARSRLWNGLAGSGLGVKATARNWATVTALNKIAAGA